MIILRQYHIMLQYQNLNCMHIREFYIWLWILHSAVWDYLGFFTDCNFETTQSLQNLFIIIHTPIIIKHKDCCFSSKLTDSSPNYCCVSPVLPCFYECTFFFVLCVMTRLYTFLLILLGGGS